jgi:hypothetical protein
MDLFLLGAMIGAAAVFIVAMPMFASWPTRLRLILAAQAPDPFFAPAIWSQLALHEVVVVDVETHGALLAVTLDEYPAGTSNRRRVLLGDASGRQSVARIESWCAAGAALLLIVDEGDDAHLYGPDGSASGRFRELRAELAG